MRYVQAPSEAVDCSCVGCVEVHAGLAALVAGSTVPPEHCGNLTICGAFSTVCTYANSFHCCRNGVGVTAELQTLIEGLAARLNDMNPTTAPARSDLIAGE